MSADAQAEASFLISGTTCSVARRERQSRGVERVVGDAAQQALDVVDAAEGLAQRVGLKKTLCEALHGVQTRLDLPRVAERAFDPVPQQTTTHRRFRAVENAEQRAALAAPMRSLCKFQTLQGGAIQRHEARARVGAQLQYVRECVFSASPSGRRAARPPRRRRAAPLPDRGLLCFCRSVLSGTWRRADTQTSPRWRSRALGALRHACGQGRSVVGDDLSGVDARQLVRQRKAHVA